MACGISWRRPFSFLERREPKALAMAADDDTLEPRPLRDGFVDAGIAFADCFSRENSVACCAPLNTTAEETLNILRFVSQLHMRYDTRRGSLLIGGQPLRSCVSS